ncbi:transposase [Bradyrhizobium sp. USDA 3256]
MKVKAFVFVATLGHSRRLHVRAFRAEKQEHWFAGLESAFTTFGGVPEEVLMDNPRALVVRHDAVSRSVQFNDKLIAFAKHWGFRPRACAPYRARTKGNGEWRRLREEERDRGAFLRKLGGIRGASRQVGA